MRDDPAVVDDERARLIALRASIATGCWALLLGTTSSLLSTTAIATVAFVLASRRHRSIAAVGALVVAVVVGSIDVGAAAAFVAGGVLGDLMLRPRPFGPERALRIALQASSVLAGLVATLHIASTGAEPLPSWTATPLPAMGAVVGVALIVVGVVGVGVCLRHLVAGGGSADPFDPPLVRCCSGPYARWRHPMLAMQSVLIVGAALVVGHVGAVVAAVVVIAVLWGPVRLHEQHMLARRFAHDGR